MKVLTAGSVLFVALALFALVVETAWAKSPSQQTIKAVPAKVAPQFTLDDLDQNPRSLDEFRGKVVAINFWATWCPPCREELPSMQRVFSEYEGQGFIILGVNVGEEWDVVAPFLDPLGLEFPILFDMDSGVLSQWAAYGLPTTYILDRDGNITHRIDGGRDWDNPGFRAQLSEIIQTK